MPPEPRPLDPPSPEPLGGPREEIDRLDHELIGLLARRMEAVRRIGDLKSRDPGAPLRDDARERELFRSWAREAQELGMSPYFVGRVLREVLNYSRRDQERFLGERAAEGPRGTRVGYQGVAGSYSDLTLGKMFATRAERVVRTGFRTFTAVVDALEAGEIDYALLPVENTIAGSINEVYDLLAHRAVSIVGEEVWAVEHCLLGLPGTRLVDLRVVRSHPVALQQCQRFLDGLVGCVTESYHDTAGAAESLARESDPALGAIASEEAGLQNGLQVLRRDISDQKVNLTRFVLIGTAPETPDPRQASKTSLLLSVAHRRGALLRCLTAFDQHGLNLTKLESRPEPGAPWEYLFYLDFEGNLADPEVQAALEELRQHAGHLKVLGCYPRRAREEEDLERWLEESSSEPGTTGPATPARPASEPEACPLPPVNSALRLVSKADARDRRPVRVGGVEIGGERFVLIAGPCAVESRRQILETAAMVKARGASILRGGAFKPRSSPYSFQGLGFPGLDLLSEAGAAYQMPVVTEVLRPEDVRRVAERADMLQVGARNMQNFALLKEIGKTSRPVLLKRGMSATVQELLLAAEYIMAEGNQRVVLCERGIRTFETATRNTLDVSAVPVLKERTHLPVIVDPSHAAGVRHLVVPLALAAAAAGADGLIVEAHYAPDEALCDKEQALTDALLAEMQGALRAVAQLNGKRF